MLQRICQETCQRLGVVFLPLHDCVTCKSIALRSLFLMRVTISSKDKFRVTLFSGDASSSDDDFVCPPLDVVLELGVPDEELEPEEPPLLVEPEEGEEPDDGVEDEPLPEEPVDEPVPDEEPVDELVPEEEEPVLLPPVDVLVGLVEGVPLDEEPDELPLLVEPDEGEEPDDNFLESLSIMSLADGSKSTVDFWSSSYDGPVCSC